MSGAKAIKTKLLMKASGSVSGTPRVVLHIDDDPNDTELLRAASHAAKANFTLHNVEDGEQAVAYLSGQGPVR